MLVLNVWCLLVCVATCESYKILFFFPHMSKSSHLAASTLVYGLASKGHEVTFYHLYPPKNTSRNVREVSVPGVLASLKGLPQTLANVEKSSVVTRARSLLVSSYDVCNFALQQAESLKLLDLEQHFDLVVLFEFGLHAYLGVLGRFDAPVVLYNSMPLTPFSSYRFGNPSLPSFLPNILGSQLDTSKFSDRLINTFQHVVYILYDQLISFPRHRVLARKYFPGSPDIYQYSERQNFLLINSHRVISDSVPLLPNSVEIGGLHLKNPQPLPEELEHMLTNSPEGVVLFSLGTYMNIADLPKEILQEIFEVFSRFPQRFLIKWTGNAPVAAPKNLNFAPWLPQSDLLAHSKMRGFITHGGIYSVMESVSNAVPVIGIPMIFDQSKNMGFVVRQGFGISIPFAKLTGSALQAALTQLLSNSTLRENVQKKGKLFKNPPRNPLDSAIFWMEYVIRHNGAHHLRYNGGKLPWYQRYLLDVLAIIVLLLFLLFLVLRQFMNFFLYR